MRFDRKKFFDGFRARIDETIEQEQVDGLEFLLGKMESDPFWKDPRQIAYALATIGHETAWSFQPVEEGYYLGDPVRVKRFQKSLRYAPYYGRGYVQLTWPKNYEHAGKILKLNLKDKPQLALDPNVAYQVMTRGMHQGWFTGKKLSDYINGSETDYKNARRIINGLDKAQLIAGYARSFEKILRDSVAVSATEPALVHSEQPVSANGESIQETPNANSTPQPTIEETTAVKTEDGEKTVTQATTVTTPKGDPPEAEPHPVSINGPLAKWLFGSGGALTIATGLWGVLSANLGSGGVIAVVCVALIVLGLLIGAIIFRGAITDAIRMQVAADPDKKNVT